MASTEAQRVALLSIRPQYAQAILAGTKSVEFRRRPLASNVNRVVIYATSPTKMVVGAFEIASIDPLPPTEAWEKFHEVGAIDKASFDHYYQGAATAYVIRIGRVVSFEEPIELAELGEDLRAPQSFVYLHEATMERHEELLAKPLYGEHAAAVA